MPEVSLQERTFVVRRETAISVHGTSAQHRSAFLVQCCPLWPLADIGRHDFIDPVGLRAYAFAVYVTDPCLGSNMSMLPRHYVEPPKSTKTDSKIVS